MLRPVLYVDDFISATGFFNLKSDRL